MRQLRTGQLGQPGLAIAFERTLTAVHLNHVFQHRLQSIHHALLAYPSYCRGPDFKNLGDLRVAEAAVRAGLVSQKKNLRPAATLLGTLAAVQYLLQMFSSFSSRTPEIFLPVEFIACCPWNAPGTSTGFAAETPSAAAARLTGRSG